MSTPQQQASILIPDASKLDQQPLVLSYQEVMTVLVAAIGSAEASGTGPTQIRVSDAALGGTETWGVTLSLGPNDVTCAPASVTGIVASSAPVYARVTQAGGHGNVDVRLWYVPPTPTVPGGGGGSGGGDSIYTGVPPQTLLPATVVVCALDRMDDPDGIRKTPSNLITNWLGIAQGLIMRYRPETQIDTSGALIAIPNTATDGVWLALGYEWLEALADYLCYAYLGTDSSDINNAKMATFYLGRFNAAIGRK